ncbi:MAG: hypothetical protein GY810_11585 [Aureispira sp.]|nr:hypothetical protein [Aureispira sp.]
MIMVLIEHFLNEEGREYLPHWVDELCPIIEEFEGFQSIQRLQLIHTNPNRAHLAMRFHNLEQLKVWARSEEHNHHIEKLAPYMLQKPHSQIFEEVD